VTAISGSELVLIIDHDLGFLMWLGEMFAAVGCPTIPALNCKQALAIAETLAQPITTLIVDPKLPGAGTTVETLTIANPGVHVVTITDSRNPGRLDGIQPRASLERPSPWEAVSRTEWVQKVRKILR
jgi:DNA-binding NtrC family response regulator